MPCSRVMVSSKNECSARPIAQQCTGRALPLVATVPARLRRVNYFLSVNRFITYATVNSGQEGRICERPKMIDKQPIAGRTP